MILGFDITIISAMIAGFIIGYTVAVIIGAATIKQLENEVKDIKRQYLDLAIAITHPIPDVTLETDLPDSVQNFLTEDPLERLKSTKILHDSPGFLFGRPIVFVNNLDIDKIKNKKEDTS